MAVRQVSWTIIQSKHVCIVVELDAILCQGRCKRSSAAKNTAACGKPTKLEDVRHALWTRRNFQISIGGLWSVRLP